ncbi:unnamed protein product [Mytilus coruscus]|uniref:ZMYM2-like/QRICH1 C-terminal domain-containing protein n=1 Tax=Mytilus coruscus TaxID=42192 RepID=A0A6J8C897_MYTCO|nr:unnamed protein product [Mytilus coruscus]
MSELKTLGKGDVQHYPAIEECDIHKLYSSIHMSTDTPCGLLNKFIKKSRDELVKNRRSNEKENFGGFMTENKDSPLCPVKSYEKLLSKLHPENNRLWQRPRDTFCDNDSVWYTKQGLGKDSISSFMTKLSKACCLSKIYTNHSIRATGTTALFKNKFADSQIMAVTGHKSVNSLAVYHRVSDQEKEEMGHAIQKVIQLSTTHQLQLQAPKAHEMLALPTVPNQNVSNELVPASNLDVINNLNEFDIDQLFSNECFTTEMGDRQVECIASQNLTITKTSNKPLGPIFSNCNIGKVEIVFKQ